MSRITELLDALQRPPASAAEAALWLELRKLVDDKRDHLYTVEDGWAELHSGVAFNYKSPTLDMIRIEDIAASLGKLCRYGGHVHTFYTVAEHSCLIMRKARENGVTDPVELLTFLLHDAPEGLTGIDANRPLKQMLPQLKAMEGGLERLIAERFGLIYPHPPMIREYDSRILRDERAQGMNPSDNDWGVDSLEPLGVELHFWDWTEAIDNFLGDYEELENARR